MVKQKLFPTVCVNNNAISTVLGHQLDEESFGMEIYFLKM